MTQCANIFYLIMKLQQLKLTFAWKLTIYIITYFRNHRWNQQLYSHKTKFALINVVLLSLSTKAKAGRKRLAIFVKIECKQCSFAELSCNLTPIQQSFITKNPQYINFGRAISKTNCVTFVSSLGEVCKLGAFWSNENYFPVSFSRLRWQFWRGGLRPRLTFWLALLLETAETFSENTDGDVILSCTLSRPKIHTL